ncbi:MAG: Terminase small subunit [Bacteriophage sp.]|nr:MAG: Terminase small subunit [Bacteriophage sp.]
MARIRNPNRDKAYEVYRDNAGEISPKKISEILNENVNNIRNWKSNDKWDEQLREDTRPGAPKGNQNAKGSKGSPGNVHNYKHGLYTSEDRYTKKNLKRMLPTDVLNLMGELEEESPVDKLWRSILLQEARIIRMQKISHVKNKKDITKELKKISKGDTYTEEYEVQFAWDKENSNMTALSKAMDTLAKMIEKYDKMIHANWDLVTEEQKLRIEVLKSKLGVKDDSNNKSISKLDSILAEIKK